MLADFQIPTLQNDMKLVVWKNHLGGQIWYRSLDPVKKRRQTGLIIYSFPSLSVSKASWSVTPETGNVARKLLINGNKTILRKITCKNYLHIKPVFDFPIGPIFLLDGKHGHLFRIVNRKKSGLIWNSIFLSSFFVFFTECDFLDW